MVTSEAPAAQRRGPAQTAERQLLELLLASPELIPTAMRSMTADAISHTGLQRMLRELYSLHESGQPADMDALRIRLIDRPDLVEAARQLQHVGRQMIDRPEWLKRILNSFEERRAEGEKAALKARLSSGTMDEAEAIELLRRIQARSAAKPSEN
jgi:DNA primase